MPIAHPVAVKLAPDVHARVREAIAQYVEREEKRAELRHALQAIRRPASMSAIPRLTLGGWQSLRWPKTQSLLNATADLDTAGLTRHAMSAPAFCW